MPNLRYRKFRKKTIKRNVLNWSQYQQSIFTDIEHGNNHTIVLAVPGSGKSTTIIEGLYHLPEEFRTGYRTINLAFSASISKYLGDKIPEGAHSKTFHQFGFHTTQKYWGPVYGINGYSVDKDGEIDEELAIEEVGNKEETIRLRKNLVFAIGLAKSTMSTEPETIERLILDHGIDFRPISPAAFALHVWNMIQKTIDAPRILNGRSAITFNDMVFLPAYYGWQPQQYDRIFIDEAQDLSEARLTLALNGLAYGGKLYAFGDNNQAIFGWAGSTTDMISKLQAKLNAKYLPLHVSYRLPKKIVQLAQTINPNIQSAPDAIDGEIHSIDAHKLTKFVTQGSAILSRTNFPLIQAIFQLLSQGINANIQGRDIGRRFLWRIWCWDPDSVEQLCERCNEWCDSVCDILISKRRPFDRIIDERNSILRLAEGASNVEEVKTRIKKFFSDDQNIQVKLSTVHKAKGLEWNDVFVLDKTFKPDKGQEETNVFYVALTRAKKNLFMASGDLV